ncbi:alpha/beta fold hydrolase [Bradyrhizobium sp. CSA207]|uniref:alpha/beta fold hydrolase n=1 Tax=Bradyrhizobium sp. CSA207 TaxID=2698826 RepID=UPI0023B0982A|nr:alpha/beta fold hydrolase [Bradyrhizobium sp. CSA207]MDE5445199.1 alpha/beta fold hydrolase [Bradyrhizobium sp. CSA207]
MSYPEARETRFRLYPGEEVVAIGRHKLLTYYRAPRVFNLPLVVFVPGGGHLGRISYGYPEAKQSDFLAHWLEALGYGMLAVSYPRDEGSHQSNSGDLTVREWGELTAIATNRAIETHALTRNVIACAWSMGGRVARSLNMALSAKSLQLEAFISLAATPPIPGLAPLDLTTVNVRYTGYIDFCAPKSGARTYADVWEEDLRFQDAQEGRMIIPASVYREEFLAETPVSIRGESDRFADGRLYKSLAHAASDMGTFNFPEWPIVGAIIPSSPRDAVHVLADKARWTFFNTQKLLADWQTPSVDFSALHPKEWQRLCEIVLSVGNRLTEHVPGNHFFFVGESGARQTAQSIFRLVQASSRLKKEISEVLDPSMRTHEQRYSVS